MALAALPRTPRRDAAAREHLAGVGSRTQPLVLARDRAIPLAGQLTDLVPGGSLVRGAVIGVEGPGGTSVGFGLAGAVTALGEWAAAVELDGTLGALAAREAGVSLERFAVARRVPPARWATVVAALLDGVSLVLAELPRGVRAGDARRLAARAREREALLVVSAADAVEGRWGAGTSLTFRAEGSEWIGLDDAGYLTGRALQVRVEGRGAAARPRTGELAFAV
ncbi:MAG TPA: hypothetical protein VH986_01335 [Acidimicrobiia bacterium]|jgi:hypothetical protein